MKTVDLKPKHRTRRQAAHYVALQGYNTMRKISQKLSTRIENIGYTVSTVLNHAQQKRRVLALIALHGDASEKVEQLFTKMKTSHGIRLSWLERWRSMDTDGCNLLDYKKFLRGCELEDTLWSQRAFSLLDKNFAGRVDFCTFFGSLPRLLVFDRANAVEIAFRMCSRWGATVTLENAILDDKDIRRIVEQRYPNLDRRQVVDRMLEILQHMDEDCSHGITFQEFRSFCGINPFFLTLTHATIKAMRTSLFGDQFWEDFTIKARAFDDDVRKEIFCDVQEDSRRPECSAFSTTWVQDMLAATKYRLLEAASSVLRHGNDEKSAIVRSTVLETVDKLKKNGSESSSAKRFTPAPGMDTSDRDPGAGERGPQPSTNMKTLLMERTSMASQRVSSRMGSFASTAQEKWGVVRRMVFDAKLLKGACTPRSPPSVAKGCETRSNVRTPAPYLDSSLRVRTMSQRLPDVHTIRAMGEQVVGKAKSGGARVAMSLKRSVRVLSNLGDIKDESTGYQPKREATEDAEGRQTPLSARWCHKIVGDPGNSFCTKNVGVEENKRVVGDGRPTSAGSKMDSCSTGKPIEIDRSLTMTMAMTMKFYDELEIATERIESRWRSAENGYDYATDFPITKGKNRLLRTSKDLQKRNQEKRREGLDRSGEEAKNGIIARSISSRQQESRTGSSESSAALQRRALSTSNPNTEAPSHAASWRDEKKSSVDIPDPNLQAKRRQQQQLSITSGLGAASDLWPGHMDLHHLVLAEEENDVPLPSELCAAYAREMIDRINRRQDENNVPILIPLG